MNSNTQLLHFQDVRKNLQAIIAELLELFGEKCSSGFRRALRFLLFKKSEYDTVYPNQSNIATNASLSRQHTNKLIQIMCKYKVLGRFPLLAKKYRHMRSCLYYFTSLFDHPEIRIALFPYLPELRRWSDEKYVEFALLMKEMTRSNEVNKYIIYGSRKSEFFGDSVNKEFKKRGEWPPKKSSWPPKSDQKQKAPPPEAENSPRMIALKAELAAAKTAHEINRQREIAENNKKTFTGQETTKLSDEGKRFLAMCPELAEYYVKASTSQ